MKKLFILLSLSLGSYSFGQITTPQASPQAKVEQKVGLADISISYYRPAKKGRVVFGDVVPFGELWRTGANENAKITTTDALIFGKDTLKAGTYAIFTKPGQTNWEIIFYTDYSNWGTPENWDDKKVALKTTAAVSKLTETVENFTIGFDKMENSSAEIFISWENTKVVIPFSLNTKDKVLASIKKTMDGPTANDYYRAASFYFTEKIDMKKALDWSTKAVELRGESAYWMTRLLAQLQAENGDYKKAIETAKKSIAAAERDGDMNYVKQNKTSIDEWSKKKN
jgi:tetratricopeptide (TPR) repeat protein